MQNFVLVNIQIISISEKIFDKNYTCQETVTLEVQVRYFS